MPCTQHGMAAMVELSMQSISAENLQRNSSDLKLKLPLTGCLITHAVLYLTVQDQQTKGRRRKVKILRIEISDWNQDKTYFLTSNKGPKDKLVGLLKVLIVTYLHLESRT